MSARSWLLRVLLICALILSVMLPATKHHRVLAQDETPIVEGIWYDQTEYKYVPMKDGDVLPRDIVSIKIRFHKKFMWSTIYSDNIQLLEPDGSKQLLDFSYGEDAKTLVIKPRYGPLERNLDYRLLFRSGEWKLLDEAGNPMFPTEFILHFKTQDVKTKTTAQGHAFTPPLSNITHQSHSFEFMAEAGELRLVASRNDVDVELQDTKGKSIEPTRTVGNALFYDLPTAGTYHAQITAKDILNDSYMVYLNIEGYDVKIPDNQQPQVYWRQFKRFESITEQTNLGIRIEVAPVKWVKVLLNGKVKFNLSPPEKGTGFVGPAHLFPNEIPDGLYRITVVTENANSRNQSVVSTDIHIDTKDSFADVPKAHWARRPIEVMHHFEILHGSPNVGYAPNQSVTREQFAKMLASTLDLEADENATMPFADIPAGSWSRPYVLAMAQAGYISGEVTGGKTYFRPGRTITRAEASAIIGRVLEVANTDVDMENGSFADYRKIPNWAKPSVAVLAYNKWVTGYPDNTFRPQVTLTRAQAAQMLFKFLEG